MGLPSSKSYLDFILDQFSSLPGITHRAMMGEYILYYRGKVFGGIYDDRLLVKPVDSARAMLPEAPEEAPYPGAKPMLLVEAPEDRQLLRDLILSIEPELPAPKRKQKS